MSLALYRKYRPKTFGDLLGHDVNRQILTNAAKADRIGQAYLFYGPRGTGKTTTARLIAKLLNCEKRHSNKTFHKKGEPCNECRACTEIDANNSLDVIEIDAASNRGIDEIRNLKENIKSAPAANTYKVYIIDEAHMLTGAAFNALLKTLEEPPAHAVFILATTEYEKLPPTITSRTQRFLFKKLPKITIFEKLKSIAEAEDIDIEDDAVELLAAAADGSFRDGESLLDQISTMEEHIDLAAAERIIGRVGLQKVDRLAALVIENNAKDALAYLSEIYDEGYNLVQFTNDLIHYLRKVLAVRINPGLAETLQGELTAEEIKRVEALGADANPETLVVLIRTFIRAYGEMRYSPFMMVPLEVALVEILNKSEKG